MTFRAFLVPVAALLVSACAFEVQGTGSLEYPTEDAAAQSDTTLTDLRPAPDTTTLPDTEPADAVVPPSDTTSADLAEELLLPECQAVEGQKEYPECDDGVACTVDTCIDNQCVNTPTNSACDAPTPCILWQCDPETGCVPDIKSGEKCGIPDNKCVLEATCSEEGTCEPMVEVTCPDSACLEGGTCNPETGKCAWEVIKDGPCDDGNPCTVDDACQAGHCQGKYVPGTCPCQTDDDCSEYQDDDLCNGSLFCSEGSCLLDPESLPDCPPAPPGSCIESYCIPETGECVQEPLPSGQPCDDGNPCTGPGSCGVAGNCLTEPLEDDTACDQDDNLCTEDFCQEGSCQPGPELVCEGPASPCFTTLCQPQTGECKQTMSPNGTPCITDPDCSCENGNTCIQGQTCMNGLCQGGTNICADCTEPALAGHPCDDGDDETLADFCFELQCRGFRPTYWLDPTAEGQGLNRVSASGSLFSALGRKLKAVGDEATLGTYFVHFNELPQAAGATPYGTPALEAIDGHVAVGPPDRVFYSGAAWTNNNKLTAAVAAACPSMPGKSTPSAVSHRRYGATPGQPIGDYYEEMVLVGFDITAAFPGTACTMALCGRLTGQTDWSCTPILYNDVYATLPTGESNPETTALWLPQSGVWCDTLSLECVASQGSIYAGVRYTILGFPHIRLLETGPQTDETGPLFSILYEESVPIQATVPHQLTDIRVTGDRLVAVGTQGLIYSRPPNSGGFVVPAFASLGGVVPHYTGIFQSETTTVLTASVYLESETADGPNETLVQTGVVAGTQGVLDDPNGFAQPYFNLLTSFTVCQECITTDLGRYGLADLALFQDHGSSDSQLPMDKPLLMTVGTVVHSDTGKAVGLAATLQAE